MAGRLGGSTALVVAATLALCACSGDDDDASADTSSPESSTTIATEPTTTLPPEPNTTTTVPLYSFDGSVPPPELVNTGDDFDAIYRTLDAYSTWLLRHNPDVNLIGEIVSPGTEQYAAYEDDLSALARTSRRVFDEISVLESVEVVDTSPTAVTVRALYTPGMRVIVDVAGTEVDRESYPGQTFVVLLSADETGRWRMASAVPDGRATEI